MKERPKEIMTIMLIGINILVFIALTMIGRTEDGYFMLQHGAMYEPYIIENQEYYRLFTSLFLHFGISHLLNNMVLLDRFLKKRPVKSDFCSVILSAE